MFDIGMNELLLVAILATVLIGPKRVPEVLRGLGKLIAEFKRATNDLRNAVNEEFKSEAGLKELKNITDEVSSGVRQLQVRAREYVEKEMADESKMANSVEREMRDAAQEMVKTMHQAAEEGKKGVAAAAGSEGEESAQAAPADPLAQLGKNFSPEGFSRYAQRHAMGPFASDRQSRPTAGPAGSPARGETEPFPPGPGTTAAGGEADSPEDAALGEINARLEGHAAPAEESPPAGESHGPNSGGEPEKVARATKSPPSKRSLPGGEG